MLSVPYFVVYLLRQVQGPFWPLFFLDTSHPPPIPKNAYLKRGQNGPKIETHSKDWQFEANTVDCQMSLNSPVTQR